MSKSVLRVERYMTKGPFTIGEEQTLAQAHRMMREHAVRHLPVLHGGRLVGVVSDRDLHLIETLRDVDPEKARVEDAMTPTVYSVSPETPLSDVASEMAEHKYGSAVVMVGDRVVGVLTTTDMMRALSDLLRTQPGR